MRGALCSVFWFVSRFRFLSCKGVPVVGRPDVFELWETPSQRFVVFVFYGVLVSCGREMDYTFVYGIESVSWFR